MKLNPYETFLQKCGTYDMILSYFDNFFLKRDIEKKKDQEDQW
jgi:hypothetical protein